MAKGPVFLNTPISLKTQDAVGVDLFVDKVNAAIDEGAQMIAITSPFGAGKSSVVEVLQHTRNKRKWWKRWEREDKFIEVSMWSHLSNQWCNRDTIELHKNFIYQMASQIKAKKGTYISRRLSQNYGLLRLHANKGINWFLTIMALLLFAVQWFLVNYSETAALWIPWLKDKTGWIAAAMIFGAIILGIVVLATTDIIFSSNKSEGARTIDGDEIMDLYRTELLKPRRIKCEQWKRLRHGTRYIVIIEDLDRTDAPETVLAFLKELRKYYVPEKDVADMYINQANFIVTIKPESLLVKEVDEKEKKRQGLPESDEADRVEDVETSNGEPHRESLYAKIFDYTLTLQTINIANYDAVLRELLDAHKDELKSLNAFGNIDIDGQEDLARLPGMKWIIRDEGIGVREIKERLNIAFTLFETLKNRSPNADITFEKCAAAAYLTTAYERDFRSTSDGAFQRLVDLYLHSPQRDDKSFTDVSEEFAERLSGTSSSYQKAVWDLIRSRQIDSSYRMYYYNYPKSSIFYTADEALVNSAIMHGEALDGLEKSAQAVALNHSKVVREAYEKLKQLGMPLPAFIFEIEPLYIDAVRYNFEELLKRMTGFDYSVEGAPKTVARIERILSFDQVRDAYHERQAKSFCELWEQKMSEPVLLQLRLMLCQNHQDEILWYNSLFYDKHNIISVQEMDALPLEYLLGLINTASADFSKKEVEYVIRRYAAAIENLSQDERRRLQETTERFLEEAATVLDPGETAQSLIEFMHTNGAIIRSFEKIVCNYIKVAGKKVQAGTLTIVVPKEEVIEVGKHEGAAQELLESGDVLFEYYQELINKVAPMGLNDETMQWIRELERYDGFTEEVALQLKNHSYIYEYVLVALCRRDEISYGEAAVLQTILGNAETLYKDNQELFLRLRTNILESNPKFLASYSAIFGRDYPIITEQELETVRGEGHEFDLQVIAATPPRQVTEADAGCFCRFFCRDNFRRKQQKNEIMLQILCYIGKMDSKVAIAAFYDLDFSVITYKNFAREKKNVVKTSLKDALQLDEPENKVRFMKATKVIDAEWELELIPLMKDDKALEKAYINAVNSCEKLSPNTASTVMKLGTIYGMAPHITSKALQEKRYFWYVVSRILWEKKFVMEEGEDAEALWDTYVEVYGAEKGNSWIRIKEYMAENTNFLYKLMERREYSKLDDDSRMKMAKLRQDAFSVQEAMGRGDEFAQSYFLKIDGFKDWEAASRFVELISERTALLESRELYEHVHDKLLDRHLKTRYTNRRKR